MFGYISTKDLYLLKLAIVESVGFSKYHYVGSPRYALAKKRKFHHYTDVFTGTEYSETCINGRESVVEERAIITDRKYLKKEQAVLMLQVLNPTCLNEKRLVKRK